MPISSQAFSISEDIFTDGFVVDIINGLMREDPISIDTVLKTREMRAAYVAFMRQYGMSEGQLRLTNRNMYHGEYIGRYDGEGEFYFPDHLLFSKVKGWFKKGKL